MPVSLASTFSAAPVSLWYVLASGISSLKVIGRTAGVPNARPATVTVGPVSGLTSVNSQRNAYLPDPTSRLIGVVVPGPEFSISAYSAPLAGLIRSISAPAVPVLRISNVCQPGRATCQRPPQAPLETEISPAGAAPPWLPLAQPASSAAHSAYRARDAAARPNAGRRAGWRRIQPER